MPLIKIGFLLPYFAELSWWKTRDWSIQARKGYFMKLICFSLTYEKHGSRGHANFIAVFYSIFYKSLNCQMYTETLKHNLLKGLNWIPKIVM